MRCPICGSKMVQKQLCKYCKITDDQIKNASNKKVKEYRKKDMKDLIQFSTVVPKDVSRIQLILFTIFFGIIGVNHYYVKRHIRGTFSVVSSSLAVLVTLISFFSNIFSLTLFMQIIYELVFYTMAVNVIMWGIDIINVFLGSFKIPVVLADKEKVN